MKKIIIMLLVVCSLLVGCGKLSSKDVVKDFEELLNKGKGYQLSGELSVVNHDEVYHYDIDVSYLKDDYYKVSFHNKANDHTQIILKNEDGVYVLTPSLNKSFRFQSEWPYDHSQIYLLNALLRDLKSEESLEVVEKDDLYVLETKTDYANNAKLTRQKIIMNHDLKPTKISVFDSDNVEAMTMIFDKVDYSPKLNKDDFSLDTIMNEEEVEEVKETGVLEEVIYPLFIPSGTKLVGEEKVNKENGQRVLMNYDGEKSFLLVEETADVMGEFTIIPSLGEPFPLMDTLGVMTDNSLSWTSGGVDFYLVSDVMSTSELVEVAESITGIVSMK